MTLTTKFDSTFAKLPHAVNRSRTLLSCGPAIRMYAELCASATWTAEAMWAVTTPLKVIRRRLGIDHSQLMRAGRLLRDVGLVGKTENGCRAVLNPDALTWAHVFLLWPSYLTETQTAALAAMISSGVVPAAVAASLLSEKTTPWEGCTTPECLPFRTKVDVEVVKLTRCHVCYIDVAPMLHENSQKTDTSSLFSTGYTLSPGGSQIIYRRESHPASPSAPLSGSDPMISEPEKEATPMREDPKEIARAAMRAGREKETKAKSKKITPGVLGPIPPRKKKAANEALRPLIVEQAGSWAAFDWARFFHFSAVRPGKERTPLWLDIDAKLASASTGVVIDDVYSNVDARKKIAAKGKLTPLMDFVGLFCREAFKADGPEERTKLALFVQDHLLPRWEYFCLNYLGPVAASKGPRVHPAYLSAVLPNLLKFYADSAVTQEDFDEQLRQQGVRIIKSSTAVDWEDPLLKRTPKPASPAALDEARLRELEKEAGW